MNTRDSNMELARMDIMKGKLEPYINEFISDLIPVWYCSFCAISFYVFPENNIMKDHGITISLYYAILGLYTSLLPIILIQPFRGKVKKIASGIIGGLGLLNVIIDVIVIETTNSLFSLEHVSLILGSNASESAEFFKTYFNVRIILIICAFEISCILVWLLSKKFLKGICAKIAFIIIAAITISTGLFSNILKSESWNQIFLCKTSLFTEYSPAKDLNQYRQFPTIDINDKDLAPKNVFVIIGESFSKFHSSLYGYDKLTNPKLGSIPDDRLFIFHNVEAADTHTIPSIKQMLTTYDATIPQEKEWYEFLTIFDIAKAMGYNTAWLSNQSKNGLFDNVVTRFAELADTRSWCGIQNVGVYKKDYDELILPMLDEYCSNASGLVKNLCFIHLMGSHPSYASRYPDKYARFSSDDYAEALDNQKRVLSEYDNSILYNDSVIYSILDIISKLDCIAIYISDHAQDIYQSTPDYYGHAIDSNPESAYWGKQVPMILYVSDSYARRNPYFISKSDAAKLNQYNLKDFVYSLADIIGVVSINNESILEKSIFAEKHH